MPSTAASVHRLQRFVENHSELVAPERVYPQIFKSIEVIQKNQERIKSDQIY